MGEAILSYTVTPVRITWSRVLKRLNYWFAVIGYSRAAAELARNGMMKQSRDCLLEIAKLKK